MKRVVRLPDVGEGVAEAELVAWHVGVGDPVTSDSVVAEVLTDKATVEVYAPIAGKVVALHGAAGDVLAVGSDFFEIETDQLVESATPSDPSPSSLLEPAPDPAPEETPAGVPDDGAAAVSLPKNRANAPRATAAPAVRERARRLGLDLATITGTGPDGHVTHGDLDRRVQQDGRGASLDPTGDSTPSTTEIPVIGLRRKIAERLSIASSRIPHITYVEEVDMTQLEQLRNTLTNAHPMQPRLTVLPFLMTAIVRAVADQPQLNATFDDTANVLTQYGSVHIGIATQTPQGLVVPVVRGAERRDIWDTAAELGRVTAAARAGTAQRNELSGSTITITSLGALGGLVTTPIINHPEVAIIGVNKMQMRPVWNDHEFVPRRMMNLSSSFDHRIVDGWDAATFIQRIKTLLEEPALLFVPNPALLSNMVEE